MKITASGATNRNAFYDRNAVTKVFEGPGTNIAPHGATTRWTYTVPTGRKFSIGSAGNYANRSAVAGTPAFFSSTIFITPSGGSLTVAARITAWALNTVDATKQLVSLMGTILSAGDVIQGQDVDGSTGGNIDLDEFLGGTEFDA